MALIRLCPSLFEEEARKARISGENFFRNGSPSSSASCPLKFNIETGRIIGKMHLRIRASLSLSLSCSASETPVTVHIHARLHMHPSTELCISVACITNVCTCILCLRYLARSGRDCISRENVLDYVYIDERDPLVECCVCARVFLFFTSSFFVFLFLVLSRWGGVSLDRDDFRGVLFRPRSTRSLSYRILASRIAPAELVFSEFFVVSGEEIRLDFEGRENLGRGIKILLLRKGDRGAFLF